MYTGGPGVAIRGVMETIGVPRKHAKILSPDEGRGERRRQAEAERTRART